MLLMLIIGCHVFDDGLIENTCEDTPLGCAGVDNSDDSGGPVDPGDTGAGLVDADGDGLTADEDCDDADPNVGAEETRYVDGDGDGYGAEEAQACPGASGYADVDGDCDDDAPEANPGEVEVCGDGLDNDCDNTANDCGLGGQYYAADVDVIVAGDEDEARAGYSVAIIGDTNGDGVNEFALGAPYRNNGSSSYSGGLALVPGDVSSAPLSETTQAFIEGIDPYDYVGWTMLGPGDLNGDGLDDLLVSAPYDSYAASYGGAVYAFFGPVTGSIDTTRANATVYGEVSTGFTGAALSGGADLDGDGAPDLAISAPQSGEGQIYVMPASIDSGTAYSVEDAPVKLYGETSGTQAGHSVSARDLNGDGIGDLAIGAPYAGVTYVVFGPAADGLSLADADLRLEGLSDNDYFGYRVLAAPDLDGDGYAELAASAVYFSSNVELIYNGSTYVFYGPLSAGAALSDADARITGALSYSYTGMSLDAGALDGTDRASLVIGGDGSDPTGGYNGTVYAFDAPRGSADTSEAYLTVIGAAYGDDFGYAVAVGEIDSDGAEDLLVGAPYADMSGRSYSGGGWILFGQGW